MSCQGSVQTEDLIFELKIMKQIILNYIDLSDETAIVIFHIDQKNTKPHKNTWSIRNIFNNLKIEGLRMKEKWNSFDSLLEKTKMYFSIYEESLNAADIYILLSSLIENFETVLNDLDQLTLREANSSRQPIEPIRIVF